MKSRLRVRALSDSPAKDLYVVHMIYKMKQRRAEIGSSLCAAQASMFRGSQMSTIRLELLFPGCEI